MLRRGLACGQMYLLHGLVVESDVPIPTRTIGPARPDVSIASSSGPAPDRSPPDDGERFQYAYDEDGTEFLRWRDLFEFVIAPDGRRIEYRTLPGSTRAALETYLFGQVLDFALLKQGKEPLHSTALALQDTAVAFLGDSGMGKSTLAAACLVRGFKMLTDDLLLVTRTNGAFAANPGLPRIKLFPEVAERVLGDIASVGVVNPFTSKLVVPLGDDRFEQRVTPLARVYVLRGSNSSRVQLRTIAPRQAFVRLSENTFNTVVDRTDRLVRHFESAAQIARGVVMKYLMYPRDLDVLPQVCDAIVRDISS